MTTLSAAWRRSRTGWPDGRARYPTYGQEAPLARENWLLAGAIAAGVIARLVFWIVTDRRIDDSLITINHAKNVADGVGLLHNLGDGHVLEAVLERFDEYGTESWMEATSLSRARSPQPVIRLLRPNWLVLRPSEWMTLRNLFPQTAREYRPVRRFAVATGDVSFESGGLVVKNIDADFTVFRRTGASRTTNE